MNWLQVTIISPADRAQALEEALKQVDIHCIHLIRGRGHGGCPNFYAHDWNREQVKVELMIDKTRLQAVKQAIKEAYRGLDEEEGVVWVRPLLEMTSIRELCV